MSKHTPGPWAVQDGKIVEKCYNGFVIADVKSATEVMQDEANARLIAAAPDLLEALKEINAQPIWNNPALGATHNLIKTAIAKAEGKENE